MRTECYISVILPLKLEWEPCYSFIPGEECQEIFPGDRVKVIFARKEYCGVVSAVGIEPDTDISKIKPILSIEYSLGRIMPEEMILWKQVADYYLCTIGEVYKAAYPSGKLMMEEASAISREKARIRKERIAESIRNRIARLEMRLDSKKELIACKRDGTKIKESLASDIARIEADIENARAALRNTLSSTATVGHASKEMPVIVFSPAQEKAYSDIRKGFEAGKPVMLHGVTGSGKTEIYIRLAEEAISRGQNILYLVPEIALSRQLEERLDRHFGNMLMCYHSGESSASRRNVAERVRATYEGTGNYIILGTRSSIFLPHHNLGLIIVDEEHDSSYKQDSPAPRYNGRDTALMLHRIFDRDDNRCNIILGSATPSLEEIFNCSNGKHIYVSMTERYHGAGISDIEVIDTIAERRKRGMIGSFSRKLKDRISQILDEGGQVMILRSRRAWSAALQCDTCGEIQKCPHCNVSMSYHKDIGKMVCHYCGYNSMFDGKCTKCSGSFTFLGAGTQKIEEEAAALFPDARIARLDSDTNQNKTYEKKIIRDFSNGDIDILIGTQMVSKGFDFGNLNLVAVISADTLLGLQDFRADEKAVQLLEQFRGRCGRRDKAGTFIIQTSQPEHPVYKCLLSEGQATYRMQLMQERMDFGFPPYSRIIELTVKDSSQDRCIRMSNDLYGILSRHFQESIVGPYKPVIDKVADLYIRKIRLSLKKDRSLSERKAVLRKLTDSFEKERRYEGHISIDVDPS